MVLSVVICDIGISYLYEALMMNRYTEQFYRTYTASSNIAIMGASRASHHYVPDIIKDRLSLTAINYGIDGHNIYTQYALLNSIVYHAPTKPEIVVLDVSSIDVYDSPKWNTEKLSILYPYYRSEGYVRNILCDLLEPTELLAVQCFGLYRHNSKYIQYTKYLITGFPDYFDGYKPLNGEWNKPIEDEEENLKVISNKKLEYFEKFIALCEKEKIKLIFAVSPNYVKFSSHEWANKVAAIAKENKIPLLYHENDTVYYTHPEWFNEPFHLNDKGARFYTEEFCDELKVLIDKKV